MVAQGRERGCLSLVFLWLSCCVPSLHLLGQRRCGKGASRVWKAVEIIIFAVDCKFVATF